ncbi:MAG: BatD family protein [Candidatus Omnitrophica bacterium]|nr:BatD family protein [Candidatus Omnitrophota bacterium]
MKTRYLLLIALFLFLLYTTVFAQATIKAEVDKTDLSTDQTLTYKLIISSSGQEQVIPKAPDFKGFQVVSSARSSQVSFEKNQIKKSATYLFVLSPEKAGDYQIGPATVKIGKDNYTTQTIDIKVKEGTRPPVQEPEPKTDLPQYTL